MEELLRYLSIWKNDVPLLSLLILALFRLLNIFINSTLPIHPASFRYYLLALPFPCFALEEPQLHDTGAYLPLSRLAAMIAAVHLRERLAASI